ncbi:MAG: hypothetical protein GY854_16320 [Deltaproteobacteria bacterium]|nr:hypothetical protein [Deltaproteobacteria bacterium]
MNFQAELAGALSDLTRIATKRRDSDTGSAAAAAVLPPRVSGVNDTAREYVIEVDSVERRAVNRLQGTVIGCRFDKVLLGVDRGVACLCEVSRGCDKEE